jgi:hypothetical protein
MRKIVATRPVVPFGFLTGAGYFTCCLSFIHTRPTAEIQAGKVGESTFLQEEVDHGKQKKGWPDL